MADFWNLFTHESLPFFVSMILKKVLTL